MVDDEVGWLVTDYTLSCVCTLDDSTLVVDCSMWCSIVLVIVVAAAFSL